MIIHVVPEYHLCWLYGTWSKGNTRSYCGAARVWTHRTDTIIAIVIGRYPIGFYELDIRNISDQLLIKTVKSPQIFNYYIVYVKEHLNISIFNQT